MKKRMMLLLMVVVCMTAGCAGNKEEQTMVSEPNISQIRSICNLATLECYYHNVAKSVKEAGTGIGGLGEKDRVFWIEYTGTARIGIDLSRVTMKIEGDQITISIPNAKLLSINVEDSSLNEESYISSDDGWNKNKITAVDQTLAINNAQNAMEEEVKNNSAVLLSAQTRAQQLIENYINQLGEIYGVDYKITWEYIPE